MTGLFSIKFSVRQTQGITHVEIHNSDEFDPNTKFLAKGAFNLILE
ncbi:MAG: hypothetical protein O2984_04345 [Bacteroidetes bacterium]|nr:hypothetical protein [Bacteroidota bacterium]